MLAAKLPAALLAPAAALLVAASGGSFPVPGVRAIAHRGGAVSGERPEGSRAAFEAALARGYAMIEVDLQESQDGEVVVHHDPTLRRSFGDPRRVADLSWAQLLALRAPNGEPPWRLDEVAARARAAGVALMIDAKVDGSPGFAARIAAALDHHGVLDSAYVIGAPAVREHLAGRAAVAVDPEAMRAAAAARPERAFLFVHGRDLARDWTEAASALGLPMVASINLAHYLDQADPKERGRQDLARALALGVREVQIDDALWPPAPPRWPPPPPGAPPAAADLVAAFARLPGDGEALLVRAPAAGLPYPFYTYRRDHDFGENHFQGVARWRDGEYLFATGANIAGRGNPLVAGRHLETMGELGPPSSELVIARLGSRLGRPRWGSNLGNDQRPPDSDRIIAVLPLAERARAAGGETLLWHAGGIARAGDLLAVPIENALPSFGPVASRVLFFDIAHPERPRRLDTTIERPDAPASAVALIEDGEGALLLAVRNPAAADFYRGSRSAAGEPRFEPQPAARLELAPSTGDPAGTHTGAALLSQRDGRLFLALFGFAPEPGRRLDPAQPGRHLVRLYEVARAADRAPAALVLLAERAVSPAVGAGHLNAAATLEHLPDGELVLYALPFWLVNELGDLERARSFDLARPGYLSIFESRSAR